MVRLISLFLILTSTVVLADTPPARTINSLTYDATSNPIGSQVNGAARGLNVFGINPVSNPMSDQIVVGGSVIDPRAVRTLTSTDTVTANLTGVFNLTPPTYSSGQRGEVQIDDNGRLLVAAQETEGFRASYSAAILGLTAYAVAGPTDLINITGSASKIIRVTRITVSATQTTAAQRDIVVLKRSTANSGGTSTTLTNVAYDSANPASTAVVRAYTVNPTLGTLVGNLRTRKVFIGTTSANSDEYLLDFSGRAVQGFTLRGANESISVNLNGVVSAGSNFDVVVEWTEDVI